MGFFNFWGHFQNIWTLKFIYSKKATKIWRNLPVILFFTVKQTLREYVKGVLSKPSGNLTVARCTNYSFKFLANTYPYFNLGVQSLDHIGQTWFFFSFYKGLPFEFWVEKYKPKNQFQIHIKFFFSNYTQTLQSLSSNFQSNVKKLMKVTWYIFSSLEAE